LILQKLYYCDHHEIPLPAGHRFPIRKYALIRELLAAGGRHEFEPAPFADPAIIALAHDCEYVERFLSGTLAPAAIRRIGFPWSEGLVRRTLASVGGTLRAVEDAMLSCRFGGNLAGGTHHASRGEGAGFCVFNDIAVAIQSLRAAGRIRRAAVIDLDVHQGDGTAAIFEDDPDVLTLSMHARHNFPFRKQRSRIDVELADGTTDEEYLPALDNVLGRVFDSGPEIVFYQSGVDGLASDTLGRLALTHEGLGERDRCVMLAARTYGAPFVVTLGGGYSNPIELTAEAHANTFRVAAEIFG
jgi:acetoin utilization deacetylase AcuC-like enzyme